MQIILCDTPEHVGRRAADIIEHRVRQGPSVLGLATGGSPASTYRELVRRHRDEGLSFRRVRAFTLDEYAGLPARHPQSYHSTIRRSFLDHVDFPLQQLQTPRGDAADLAAECARYESAVAAAGVDIQLLGLGANGHIGFNEPTSSLRSRTRVKTLAATTRSDNARYFGNDLQKVPRLCLTQGLATICESRQAVLVAHGRSKAPAVRNMIEGPLSAFCPASVLQLHPHSVVILDSAAAAELTMNDYYRHTQDLNDQLALSGPSIRFGAVHG